MPVETAILRALPLFARLSDSDLLVLRKCVEPLSVPRGRLIVSEDDAADAMYVIHSGRAKVAMFHDSGREVILTILGPNDFFGEMSLFDSEPRSASVQAIDPCSVLRLPKTDFFDMLKRNHEMAMVIIGGMVARLRDANRKIESLSLIDVYGRVARLLLDECEEIEGAYVIRRSMRKTEIASMIGASREMVSRVMSDFERRGHIRIENGRIFVLEKNLVGKKPSA